jgi:hypothetical protein
MMLVRIAHHPGDAGQGSYFARSPLGIAAGNHDPGVGIVAMGAADRGPSVLVGRSRYGAGVEDHKIGFARRTEPRQALTRQLTFQGGAIRLGGAASEAVQKKSRHESIIEGQLGIAES